MGAGPGTYRMTRGGALVWAKELPVTLWHADVTDRGYAGGFGYSEGVDGHRARGTFNILIFSPSGEVLLNEETKRVGSGDGHLAPDPQARRALTSDTLDRLVIWTLGPRLSLDAIWKSYRLSTAEFLGTYRPERPELSHEDDFMVLSEARVVPGTPLSLAWWWSLEFSNPVASGHYTEGGVFTLHDPEGETVWSLELRGDYTVPEDEKAQGRLKRFLRQNPPILDVSRGRFSLWFVEDEQRVEFEVSPGEDASSWIVERGAAVDHLLPAEEKAVSPPVIELRRLASVELKPQAPTVENPIRDVVALGFADTGAVKFIRREEEQRVFSCVRIRKDGEMVEVRLPPIAPELEGALKWFDPGGETWLAALCKWGPGQKTRLFRADPATASVEEIEGFDCPSIDSFAATGDGGFVAVTTTRTEYTLRQALMRFNADGALLWRIDADGRDETKVLSPEGVAFTREGRIAVVDKIRDALQVLDSDGSHVRSIDLTESWSIEPRYPTGAWADRSGNVLVDDDDKLWRMDLDGTLLETIAPRRSAEEPPTDFARRFAVAPDGAIWCTDGTAIYRLGADGIVDRVLGAAPSADVLRNPDSSFIDRCGRILVKDARSGAVHAFDETGASLFVCTPEPGELQRVTLGCLAVDERGHIYVANKLHHGWQTKPQIFLRFDEEGRRIGMVDLGFKEVVFDPSRPARWAEHPMSFLSLIDEKGEILAEARRRPDRRWFRQVDAFDVLNDGTLVVVDGPDIGTRDQEGTSIVICDRSGSPLRMLPVPVDRWFHLVAASSRWIALGAHGSRQLLVRVADGAVFDFDPCRGEENKNAWRYGFSPDEGELWGVEVGALKLHRFALPD